MCMVPLLWTKNRSMNIPSGPQAMAGQQGYWGGQNGSMRGVSRGGARRGY
jgi:hypothetical protein